MEILEITGGIIAGLVCGVIITSTFLKKTLIKKGEAVLKKAEADADVIKKEKILQAKEKFLQLKEEHESLINNRNRQISQTEEKLRQKESIINKKLAEVGRHEKEVETIKKQLSEQLDILNTRQVEMDKLRSERVGQLEKISGISAEEARDMMMKVLKDEARTNANAEIKTIMDETKITASREAKKIVIQAIQRLATEEVVENSVSVFNIENNDLKGRIIGREGRNIRAMEAATGVEIIIDDTPEAILLSCFDPVRREIARLAMHQLVSDGRIHPARIEEVVNKTTRRLNEEILEIGKQTAIDLGIHGLHHELIRYIGKMKYRSSYGQNLLQHSRETANLCSIMAAELGLNPKLAKRAGLLHDLGKVSDEELELPHAVYGMKLAEKYGERTEVCNAIGSHHDEVEMNSLIAPIVQVCDAISGARPGARREVLDSYIQRLKDLESIAMANEGVERAYAIQAGRELRVMVASEKMSDKDAEMLSFNISQKIQNEMTYPGQVKVTVIREVRAINYAK